MSLIKKIQAKDSPNALNALKTYEIVRTRLQNYFFKKQNLIIQNELVMQAYNAIYSIMNNMKSRMAQDKYLSYDQTFLKIYRKDLINFCQQARKNIKLSQHLKANDFIQHVLTWVYNYTRFMHWTFKSFMVIQKNSLYVKGTNLYFQGLSILRKELIQPIYQQLFTAIYQSLQASKNEQNKSNNSLIQIIKIIGSVGFKKFTYLKLQKQGQKYVFVSKEQKNKNITIPQIGFETQFFKCHFTNKLVKVLKQKYFKISQQIIKLSTPQYVQRALKYLKTQQQIANIFYPTPSVKQFIINSLNQVLCHDRAQSLIKKPQTGLFSMLERSQLKSAKQLYILINRSSNQKMFRKQYQRFIQTKGNQILDKVNAEDQKNAKKQAVSQMIQSLYKLYELMQQITSQVASNDTSIQSSQTYGFQQICNKSDKTCNFLAYYVDNILRKDQQSSQILYLPLKISKISKYLHSYDAFIKLYQRLLGLRMLFDTYKKIDTQKAIISLLKNQAGITSLTKVSTMVSDYEFSEQFAITKRQELKKDIGFSMDVMVLTSGAWQIHDSKCSTSTVPAQLLPATQAFNKIYAKQLPDRTLTWVFNYGRAIVLAHFNNQGKYVLTLNNYQLCILLYLQRVDFRKTKVSQLLTQLKVQDQGAFNASLTMLLKSKVLLKQGDPMKINSKSQHFTYNMNFKHTSGKVRCFQLPRYIEKGNNDTGQLVIQRSHLLDAAIVKIMKSKRNVLYNDLVNQVQKMCKTFKADILMIKKRIENCQERQFLERDPEDMNMLIYKP